MKTILLVEDDKNQLLFYEQELASEGYAITTARDGFEAVKKVQEKSPDLIVMDINMPRLNGIEAISKILVGGRKIPIIINTAYSSYKDNFMTWSADAYIIKSSDLTELKNKIKEFLSKPS
ncbi:MAG TPA: response regulator [Candidatus Brocadiaceae bacterium]